MSRHHATSKGVDSSSKLGYLITGALLHPICPDIICIFYISTFCGHFPHFVDISLFCGYYLYIMDIVDLSASCRYYFYWSHYKLLISICLQYLSHLLILCKWLVLQLLPVCNLIYISVTSSFCIVCFVSECKINPNPIRIYVPLFITLIKYSFYFLLNFRFMCCIGVLYYNISQYIHMPDKGWRTYDFGTAVLHLNDGNRAMPVKPH